MQDSFADFLATLAAPRRAPAGIAAAAAGAAMALALLERALAYPAEDDAVADTSAAREMAASLRQRVLDVIEADATAEAALDEALGESDEDADARQAGARVPAYRAARRLLDFTIQGLTLLRPTLDHGSRLALADLETAWRLMATALEAAIAACEQHLLGLSSFFAEAERPALETSTRQGRELVDQAVGEMSWRLGRR